jgi:hypothetical protein
MKNYNRVLFTLRSCQCGYFLQALTRLSWLPEVPRHTEAQGSITLDGRFTYITPRLIIRDKQLALMQLGLEKQSLQGWALRPNH